jgi:hypothetical protein
VAYRSYMEIISYTYPIRLEQSTVENPVDQFPRIHLCSCYCHFFASSGPYLHHPWTLILCAFMSSFTRCWQYVATDYGRTRGSVGLRRKEGVVRNEDTVKCNMQNVAFRLGAKWVERNKKVTCMLRDCNFVWF